MFDAATRFNKSFRYIRPTLLGFDFDLIKKALHLPDKVAISFDANGVPHMDASHLITVESKGIQHVHTALEASNHITTIKVVPVLENIEASFWHVSSEVMDPVAMVVSSLPARELATATLSAIEHIVFHDLWAASQVIHSGLCGLSDLSRNARGDVKAIREVLVRKIVRELCLHTRTDDRNSSDKMCREAVAPIGSNLGATT